MSTTGVPKVRLTNPTQEANLYIDYTTKSFCMIY